MNIRSRRWGINCGALSPPEFEVKVRIVPHGPSHQQTTRGAAPILARYLGLYRTRAFLVCGRFLRMDSRASLGRNAYREPGDCPSFGQNAPKQLIPTGYLDLIALPRLGRERFYCHSSEY